MYMYVSIEEISKMGIIPSSPSLDGFYFYLI